MYAIFAAKCYEIIQILLFSRTHGNRGRPQPEGRVCPLRQSRARRQAKSLPRERRIVRTGVSFVMEKTDP
jgi:hypothetical protein